MTVTLIPAAAANGSVAVPEASGATISPLSRIYPNVQLGEGCEVGDFVLIGVPPKGKEPGALPTVIGPGAVIRSHTVIYAGNVIGAHFQAGHAAMIRECNTIGESVSVGSHSVVEHHVEMEDRVRIHSQAFVPEYTVLRRGAWVGREWRSPTPPTRSVRTSPSAWRA
jgi:UDP-3-O-[3-hydroxymyristoyl] glucosamine N-acyltransferase